MIDRVLFNGRIHTLNPAQPLVSALALSGERIVAAGSDDDLLPLAGRDTVCENLDGQTLIPGLTDAHIHWQLTAERLQAVDLFGLPRRAAVVERVAARAQVLPPGTWITGYGWAQDDWDDRRFPSAADLDASVSQHPVYLCSKSIHAAWVNSAALRLCGLDASTPDPIGGQLVRDEHGRPTGLLLERPAMNLVEKRIPRPTTAVLADWMEAAQAQAHAVGLTGLHDFDNPDCLAALQVLRERGTLGLRVLKNINAAWLDAALASGLRWGFGDHWLRIGGLKLFADGALGPRTAWMFEPYEGEPDNTGIVVTEKEAMIELVARASAAGLPLTIHAIGDRAVHDVLDVYEVVRQQEAERGEAHSTRRHRVEHVQLLHPADAHRLASLHLIASMQPIHATADYEIADRYWGARAAWGYNPALQLQQGVVVAFGSDSPVESFDPLAGIHAAVTRRRPDGSPGPDGWYPDVRISVVDALHAYTVGPAYAAGLEAHLGQLAPGRLADLVVLNGDPLTTPADELLSVRVCATMVGGMWRFGRG